MRPPTATRTTPSTTTLHPMRLLQPVSALLSLACFAVSTTEAFLLNPQRTATPTPTSQATGAGNRRAATASLPSATTTTTQGSLLLPRQRIYATRQRSWPGVARPGGIASLKSVATPAELEKASGLGELLHPRNGVNERFVFFGGKGGVGKTSTAAAVAIQCADAGLR